MAVKKFLYSFILLALLAFKVSAMHVYLHQEEDIQIEDCELCEHAVQNQNAAFSVTFPPSIPLNATAPINVLKVERFETPALSNALIALPFTRPPPTAI